MVITILILVLALGVATNLTPQTASAQSPSPKLDEIRARGSLNCGVGGSLPGFSNPNPDTGRMEGIDADFCRALAVAVFGADYTEDSVVFVPLTADVRFTALQSNQVDVLIRNTTWTLTRDITMGANFGPTTFYDGQGLLVRVADGYTSLADMEGATICTQSGTTTEKNITDAYRAQFGADPALAFAQDPAGNLADFESGVCDVMTSDKSQLAGLRSVAADPSSLAILPDTLSKEPLGPMYLASDPVFGDVVDWTVYATFQAEELGITSANVDEVMTSEDVLVQRFLGLTEDNFGAALGISNSFAADIIRTVGNYGEIYERNVTPIGVPREGTLNALWTNGGLLYSPAWR
jgi:general L-amino acid transport system substrate-binding protein